MPAAQQRRDSDNGMSLGEVARLIEALRTDTTGRFDRLDARLDTFDATYLRRETYIADRKAAEIYTGGMESRIGKLEGTLQWVLRSVGGAFIAAVIGLFFVASKWV